MLASGKAIARTLFRVGLLPLVGVSKCLSIAFPGPLAPPDFLYGKSATGDPGCGGGDRVPGGPLTNRKETACPAHAPDASTIDLAFELLSAHGFDSSGRSRDDSRGICIDLHRAGSPPGAG